jgi:hypothetical protein
MERNFEVVPDRFQISEIYVAKKLGTKRGNCVTSSAAFSVQLEAFIEMISKLWFAKALNQKYTFYVRCQTIIFDTILFQ